jgi:uncharacterized Fe-S cluster protein YjdI
MELKKGMFVIAPEGCQSWLTAGKAYQVVRDARMDLFFEIIDDKGDEISCMLPSDNHVKNIPWIIQDSFTLENITHIIQTTPNDMELGQKIRNLLNK